MEKIYISRIKPKFDHLFFLPSSVNSKPSDSLNWRKLIDQTKEQKKKTKEEKEKEKRDKNQRKKREKTEEKKEENHRKKEENHRKKKKTTEKSRIIMIGALAIKRRRKNQGNVPEAEPAPKSRHCACVYITGGASFITGIILLIPAIIESSNKLFIGSATLTGCGLLFIVFACCLSGDPVEDSTENEERETGVKKSGTKETVIPMGETVIPMGENVLSGSEDESVLPGSVSESVVSRNEENVIKVVSTNSSEQVRRTSADSSSQSVKE